MKRCIIMVLTGIAILGVAFGTSSAADKPNILVIWGDDIGVHNISAYNHGIMGYQTPNIDRIANEGALFTDRDTAGQAAAAGDYLPADLSLAHVVDDGAGKRKRHTRAASTLAETTGRRHRNRRLGRRSPADKTGLRAGILCLIARFTAGVVVCFQSIAGYNHSPGRGHGHADKPGNRNDM